MVDREKWNALDLRSQVIWAGHIGIASAADVKRLVNPGGLNEPVR